MLKSFLNKIMNEPMVVFGAVVAGLSAVTDQSWQAYAMAALIALSRFIVSPSTPTL